jgi:hypothetical protein
MTISDRSFKLMTMKQDLPRRALRYQRSLEQFKQRLSQTQTWRLSTVVFGLGCLAVSTMHLSSKMSSGLQMLAVVIFLTLFPYFVVRSRRIRTHCERLERLTRFYSRIHRRRQGHSEPNSPEATLLSWPAEQGLMTGFARDLHLFGPHSLFALINEAFSDGGRLKLASQMIRPNLHLQWLQERQKSIRALAADRWALLKLIVLVQPGEFELSTQQISGFIQKKLVPERFALQTLIIYIAWILSIALLILGNIKGWNGIGAVYLVYLAIGFSILGKIGPIARSAESLVHHFAMIRPLFEHLETTRASEQLRSECQNIRKTRPSRKLVHINRSLSFLSIEANPLVYLILNALCPWTATFALILDRQRAGLETIFPKCLDELNELEASLSLAFTWLYLTPVFPELGTAPVLKFKQLAHPLLPLSTRVANDFEFRSTQSLGLITGSNMSGKSTFLRTVGSNQILANMGAPVFAKEFQSRPCHVSSCIEVSDSLRDGFSYFYSEVLCLKKLIDQVDSGEPTLFLIDEIFRGTNNFERQIGSKSVIQALLKPSGIGFVSTHDLELAQMPQTEPRICNLHFREDIVGSEMIFRYLLLPGPSPSTNALKIMQMAGIPILS